MSTAENSTARRIAVTAEALYLCNLLLLPIIAFALLLALYFRYRHSDSELVTNHLHRALAGSLLAAALLLPLPVLTLAFSGPNSANAWTVVILYIVVCHTALVMLGIIALARAMAGRTFQFPLIGGIRP